MKLPDVDDLVFTFWHWMEVETDTIFREFACDGGIVELSSDNGISWTQIFPQEDYQYTISEFIDSGPFIPGTLVYSGKHEWKREISDLMSFKGEEIKIRFHFGTEYTSIA